MKKIILLIIATSTIVISGFAQRSKKESIDYGKNIIRLNPISFFEYGGVGFGLGYERILSEDGNFGLKIPFFMGMRTDNFIFGQGGSHNSSISNYSLMINPGIKFYPTGQRKITYGLGFSVFGIFGSNNHYEYIYNSQQNKSFRTLMDGSHINFGMMVDNSIQFNLTPKFNIGLEVGVGPSYYNSYTQTTQGPSNTFFKERRTEPLQMMGSFNFHIGYSF